MNHLKNQGFSVFALEQTEGSVSLLDYCRGEACLAPTPIALILGNEVDGVSDDILPLIDGAFEIPQFGTKHSLNVSVSAGIAIWEIFKKMNV